MNLDLLGSYMSLIALMSFLEHFMLYLDYDDYFDYFQIFYTAGDVINDRTDLNVCALFLKCVGFKL